MRSASSAPVFVVGAPRSGTSLLFESILHHEDLAWLPAQWRFLRHPMACGLYLRAFKNRHWERVRHKRQSGDDPWRSSDWKAWQPTFDEAYPFWQGFFRADMATSFLLEERPEPDEVARIRRWIAAFLRASGARRLAHKFTGPPRIGFLDRVFEDAVFVHVVRSCEAVVNSLLKEPFWRDGGGLESPWWHDLPEPYLAVYRARSVPEVLAAVQWRAILDRARTEAKALAPERYVEVAYEDVVADPRVAVGALLAACDLPPSPRVDRILEGRAVRDRNREAPRVLGAEAEAHVAWALDTLDQHGGPGPGPAPRSSGTAGPVQSSRS